MKILIDMNLTPLWVQFFEKEGIEAVHWPEIGDPAAKFALSEIKFPHFRLIIEI